MSDGRTWGTVIGGIIGYFVPVIGWAAGAAIGGAVGGLLEPTKKVEQGRIDDLKVSVSQYGTGIPETWGNNAPPATWVWATDVIEIGQTQGGGKGGGGTEVTQYRQFIHGYLVLGRTPPVGSTIQIRKAWVDGKLTYDASSGLSVAQALASEENPFAQISLHPGWEDQIPHPIMEFYEGIGNTPAYRGVVGVFVFGLECPGGRIPQLSFEICINATTTSVMLTAGTFPTQSSIYSIGVAKSDAVWNIEQKGGGIFQELNIQVRHSSGPTGYVVNEVSIPGTDVNTKAAPVSSASGTPYVLVPRSWGFTGDSTEFRLVNLETGDVEVYQGGQQITYWGQSTLATLDETTSQIYVAIPGDLSLNPIRKVPGLAAINVGFGTVTALGANSGLLYALIRDGSPGRSKVLVIDPISQTLMETVEGPLFSETYNEAMYAGDDGVFVFTKTTLGFGVFKIENGQYVQMGALWSSPPPSAAPLSLYADNNQAIFGPINNETSTSFMLYRYGVISPTEAPISVVIESQCERVGLSGELDVSTIDDKVWGYTFNKSPASARNNIAPLLTYAGVAQVEEDGIIRLFHRGDKTPVATIGYDELGCTEDGQEPGDPFPLTRTQEAECPRSVTVQYVNPLFDYQTSTETARRIVTDSEFDETVTLDVAMTPDKAATIAHRTLYERWISRDTRSFKVSRKFAALSPGDVVTIEYPRGTTGNYMLAKVNDTGALIEAECVPADAELLTQSIPGTNGYTGQQIAPLAPPTLLTVVDSRILRDADNNAGLYAAMAGFGPGWSGSELWAGDDANALVDRGGVTTEAVQGVCETTLGAYTLGNVDEHNLLTVNVGNGSLSTITRDALLNGSANVAVVGAPGRWEVIKFQRADDLGSGRYILSGLLRGLQGSEFAMSQHAAGDWFVLLSGGGVLRPNFDPGTIGQEMAFKAVSVGRRFDSVAVQTAENTGEGLRPSSPTTLRKSFSTNDIVLTWGRRTRLSQQWWLGNVPLGEESERYEIDIFSDNTYTTVKRTLTSTSSTVTYTSAQQVADFGSNQTTVYVRIYQMSGTVGRGHELQQAI